MDVSQHATVNEIYRDVKELHLKFDAFRMSGNLPAAFKSVEQRRNNETMAINSSWF
ncbi:hypothetical protein EJB05_29997 [Eragrostis curvula]|uniref:Uncharacterized protein n=1 Tax=Eragrostis curvula TaxID=38414 RepID=A0A5J9UVU8_9POAL|nr:hypothetical protein EJB05_29997 [Eragrostis curvula]